MRPTTLRRETPSESIYHGFQADRPIYRSLQSDLNDDLFRSSNSNFESDLSRPTVRSLIDSSHSGSDLLPSPTPLKYSKSSPFASAASTFGGTQIQQFSALSKDLPKEPPAVPGGYLEPFYHLISRQKASSLFDLISQALLSLRKQISYSIEMDMIPRKYKIKCCAYPLGEPKVPFTCRIFLMDPDEQGKRYALEFQRRSGCVIQFSDLWSKCKRFFLDSGLFTKDNNELPSQSPIIAKLDVQVSDGQIRDTLKSLLQMATSKCCDVKSQALAVLSKMSTEEQSKPLMIEESCIEALIAAVFLSRRKCLSMCCFCFS